MLPKIHGLTAAYQRELIGLLDDLIAIAGLDADVARRADWLRLGLRGRKPEDELPFVHDVGPLAPAAARERAAVTAAS